MIHVHIFRKINKPLWKAIEKQEVVGGKAYKRCRCGEIKEYSLEYRQWAKDLYD